MTSLLAGAAFVAGLAIAAPVWAQSMPAPETAPGGAVVLRGSPANLIASPPATEASSRSGYYKSSYPYARYFGVDQSFNGNFDNTGFDRRFNGTGLTR
jgi:hypothetical protein